MNGWPSSVKLLVQNHCGLLRLEERQKSLEDIFLALTGGRRGAYDPPALRVFQGAAAQNSPPLPGLPWRYRPPVMVVNLLRMEPEELSQGWMQLVYTLAAGGRHHCSP